MSKIPSNSCDALCLSEQDHSWHPGGWKRLWSPLRRRLYETWLVLTGKHSLHRAWQYGYDQSTMMESRRRANGGK